MDEKHYFADVDLPFHVWVRERSPDGDRWVLREAPGAPAGPPDLEWPACAPPNATGSAASPRSSSSR